jgi:hypothetical protein
VPLPRSAVAAALALSTAGVAAGFALGRATAPKGVDARDLVPVEGLPTESRPLPRDAGSVWRRFTSSSPEQGKESLLLTPRPGDLECTEDCPLALRVHGGATGGAERDKVMRSLDAALDDLLAAARPAAPEFARALEAVVADQRRRAGGAPSRDGLVPRVLLIGMPRAEYGARAFGVHLVAYAQHDPHFDLKDSGPPRGGMRLSLSRIESCPEGSEFCALVAGDVSVSSYVAGEPDPARGRGDGADAVATLRGPSLGHFRGFAGRSIGLFLAPDGGVSLYDADLMPRLLPANDALRRALAAVLRRA